MRPFCAFFIFAWFAAPAIASPCETIEAERNSYVVCAFDARDASIRLFLRDGNGEIYGGFSNLVASLQSRGENLIFAMNAGMYGEDRLPVGLYVEAGKTAHAANTHPGRGNFHMKPNGVFWVDGARAGVTETSRFLKQGVHPVLRHAIRADAGYRRTHQSAYPRQRHVGKDQKRRLRCGRTHRALRDFEWAGDLSRICASFSRTAAMSRRSVSRRLRLVALCALCLAA